MAALSLPLLLTLLRLEAIGNILFIETSWIRFIDNLLVFIVFVKWKNIIPNE